MLGLLTLLLLCAPLVSAQEAGQPNARTEPAPTAATARDALRILARQAAGQTTVTEEEPAPETTSDTLERLQEASPEEVPEEVTEEDAATTRNEEPAEEFVAESFEEPAETPIQEPAEDPAAEPEAAPAADEAPDDEVPEDEPLPDPDTEAVSLPEPLSPNEPVDVAALELVVQDGDLLALQDGRLAWQLGFPEESGPPGDLLRTGDDRLFYGHGNSVLRVSLEDGTVQERWLVSGPVARLRQGDDGTILITTNLSNGAQEQFTLQDGEIQEVVRFDSDPALFGWLQAEANVPNPQARLEQDPTNPWLYLSVPLERLEANPQAARERFERALARAETFYDFSGISRVLLTAGQRDLAAQAFDAAMADFAERGYNPRLLRDPALASAYNFPLEPFCRALQEQSLERASFWAERVIIATPNVPGAREALLEYAALLDSQGDAERAAYWREEARLRTDAPNAQGLERFFIRLAQNGWGAALALAVAILLLHWTLVFKYWVPQSEALRGSRRARAFLRLWSIRYYSFTEKLVLVLLYLSVAGLVGLAHWHDEGRASVPYAGTLASTEARTYLASDTFVGPRADFIRGYAAQVAGEEADARALYAGAGAYPPALNNLGALERDERLFQRALSLAPGLAEARYNLGRQTGGFPFESRYQAGAPVLAVPEPHDFMVARAGTWEAALGNTFTTPWELVTEAQPPGLSRTLWTVLWIIFVLAGLITLVWLFIPRPRFTRNAPRTPPYHVMALLVPGSGQADEAWGLLLIVPWALLGYQVLGAYFGWPFDLGVGLRVALGALGLLYVINIVTFIIEFMSYRRRMRAQDRLELRETRSAA
jgi:hypothetical protein